MALVRDLAHHPFLCCSADSLEACPLRHVVVNQYAISRGLVGDEHMSLQLVLSQDREEMQVLQGRAGLYTGCY